jgi:TRAP-type C4-dicarboxylate transport system substrate-binding protein
MPIRSLSLALASTLLLATGAPARTLKIATIAPGGSSWMREMQDTAGEIALRTQGRVVLKFYPGGVMGNDQTVLRKMRAGQLQGGAFPSGTLGRILPDVNLYSLPLMFRSYDEVDFVRKQMDADLTTALEREGFIALALSDNGFAYLMSTRPVRAVGDLAGARVWIPEDDVMSQTALEVLGVSPVQLPLADVYTALQTGLVDTVAAPPMGTVAFQWHTKVKYLTDVPLMYLLGLLVVDAKAWSQLRSDDRSVVRELVRDATRRLDAANRAGEENAREALQRQGIEFVEASSPEELERWHDITRQALVELRDRKIYSDERIDRIQGQLEGYRRGERRLGSSAVRSSGPPRGRAEANEAQ